MHQVQLTVVDDVPIYWVDGKEDHAQAGLIFRVGMADESLQTHGISHLIEHLTLGIGEKPFDFNGSVDDTQTTFFADGTPAELAGFLETVATRLIEPDLGSIELHARVLRTEAGSAPLDRIKVIHNARFGTQGYGLRALAELALHWVGPADAQAWIDRFFTAQNAVAWMTCPPPKGLRFRLPRGERVPPPAPGSRSLSFPAYFGWNSDEVAVSFLGDESAATWAGLRILERALTQDLRHERGVSYAVGSLIACFTPDVWHYLIFADCLPEASLTVRDQMLSTLRRLERRGPEQSELDTYAARAVRTMEKSTPLEMVRYEAARRLVGNGFIPFKEFVEACGKLTPQEVTEAMSRLMPTALMAAPRHLQVPAGWRQPKNRDIRVVGRKFALAKGANAADTGKTLIVGPEGVTIVLVDEEVVTVRFDRCVCVGWDREGWRVLWDEEGRISVVPQLWKKGATAVSMIDDAVSRDLFAPLEGAAPGPRLPFSPPRPDRKATTD